MTQVPSLVFWPCPTGSDSSAPATQTPRATPTSQRAKSPASSPSSQPAHSSALSPLPSFFLFLSLSSSPPLRFFLPFFSVILLFLSTSFRLFAFLSNFLN